MPKPDANELSDLFRWMVANDRVDLLCRGCLFSEDVDAICSLIEGKCERWQEELQEYRASLPEFGIGTNPSLTG